MHQLALELATLVALVVAGLVGAIGVWFGLSVWAVALRVLISGGLVFFFTFVGATILGRSILGGIALEQAKREQNERGEREQQEAAERASEPGEGSMWSKIGTPNGAPAESTTAESGRNVA